MKISHKRDTQLHEQHTWGSLKSGVMGSIFIYGRLGFFTQNRFGVMGSGEGHQSSMVKNVFRTCIRKKYCGQYINDKDIFVEQISDNLQCVHTQNHLVGYMRPPIRAP